MQDTSDSRRRLSKIPNIARSTQCYTETADKYWVSTSAVTTDGVLGFYDIK